MKLFFYLLHCLIVLGLFASANIQQELPPPIEIGMSREEVENILGKPQSIMQHWNDTNSIWTYTWQNTDSSTTMEIHIGPQSGKVVKKDVLVYHK